MSFGEEVFFVVDTLFGRQCHAEDTALRLVFDKADLAMMRAC